jgi:hypothetical protein
MLRFATLHPALSYMVSSLGRVGVSVEHMANSDQ